MSFRETKLQRYAATEKEADAFGRMITVKRLQPWDRQLVMKLIDTDRLSVGNRPFVAACVCEIVDDAGTKVLFAAPKTEADLAVVMNTLDDEGLDAAMIAFARLMGYKVVNDGEDADAAEAKAPSELELAKNS